MDIGEKENAQMLDDPNESIFSLTQPEKFYKDNKSRRNEPKKKKKDPVEKLIDLKLIPKN